MLDYSLFTFLLILARVAAASPAVNANAVFYSLRNEKAILPFDAVAQANRIRLRHAATRGASTDLLEEGKSHRRSIWI